MNESTGRFVEELGLLKISRYSKYSRISNYSCKLWEREIPKNPNIPDIQEIPLNVLIQTWWNSKYTIYSTYSGNSIYFGTAYEKIPQIPSFQFTVKFKKQNFKNLNLKKKLFQNSDYSIILGGSIWKMDFSRFCLISSHLWGRGAYWALWHFN